MKIAVVGGGWAGLAAAVTLSQAGQQVSLFEMAARPGGRARSLDGAEPRLDNGQHILIGAYRESLDLMRQVGARPDELLLRLPLRLRYPQHEGLRLPPGPPLQAFARAVLGYGAWPWRARLALLRASLGWTLSGFDCDPRLSVDALCQALPAAVRQELIDPLCVAALNTPAREASAQVFLRVLRDALFSGPGSADLLLPRRPLSELLAEPAAVWLEARDAALHWQRRISRLEAGPRLDGEAFDAVILACSAGEAARLAAPLAPDWAARAAALRFEPIVTVYLESPGSALPAPMVALHESAEQPAQFAFDLGQLGHAPGRFAFVISGAAPWVARGLDATAAAVLAQAQAALAWRSPPTLLRCLAEKRATFACTPGLQRPAAAVAPGIWAAGDYVDGPYPATLEGAVRSGRAAAQAVLAMLDAQGPLRP